MTRNSLKARVKLMFNLAQESLKVMRSILDDCGKHLNAEDTEAVNDCLMRLLGGEVTCFDEFLIELMKLTDGYEIEEGPEVKAAEISVPYPDYPVCVDVKIDTGKSNLCAFTCASDYDTAQAGVVYEDKKGCILHDLCMAEVKKGELAEMIGRQPDSEDVDVYLYGDPYSEDYTKRVTLPYKNIIDAVEA